MPNFHPETCVNIRSKLPLTLGCCILARAILFPGLPEMTASCINSARALQDGSVSCPIGV
jgi:hypothetical protein